MLFQVLVTYITLESLPEAAGNIVLASYNDHKEAISQPSVVYSFPISTMWMRRSSKRVSIKKGWLPTVVPMDLGRAGVI